MLEPLLTGLTSFLAALSGAVIPGPVFTLVLSESLKGGRAAGPLIVSGHFIIEAIVILMIFMGFQQLLESKSLKTIIGYIGGAVLLLMGLKLILDALKVGAEGCSTHGVAIKLVRMPPHNLVFSGFLASCSNPHFFLWWLTVGLPIMVSSISTIGALGFVFFLIGHAAADLSWFSFVSYSAYKSRRILSGKIIKVILILSGAFLVYFAANTLISSTFMLTMLAC